MQLEQIYKVLSEHGLIERIHFHSEELCKEYGTRNCPLEKGSPEGAYFECGGFVPRPFDLVSAIRTHTAMVLLDLFETEAAA